MVLLTAVKHPWKRRRRKSRKLLSFISSRVPAGHEVNQVYKGRVGYLLELEGRQLGQAHPYGLVECSYAHSQLRGKQDDTHVGQ